MEYYIQGDAANADRIKAAFEKLGYDISWPEGCANPDIINIGVERSGAKYVVAETSEYIKDIIKTHPDYKELELPKPHYDIANFHAGMPVLVRDGNCHEWRYVTFSHYRKVGTPFCAGGQYWSQCIPFDEGTKHLLGTTDMPSEEYINW